MKVIFLDVDGVLNYSSFPGRFSGFLDIDPDKVDLLKQIVDATDAQIVLSSTWRLTDKSFDRCREKLGEVGLTIVNSTPTFQDSLKILDWPYKMSMYYLRCPEILSWLLVHKDLVTSFVILDDGVIAGDVEKGLDPVHAQLMLDRTVKTSFYGDGGLQPSDVQKAIAILARGK